MPVSDGCAKAIVCTLTWFASDICVGAVVKFDPFGYVHVMFGAESAVAAQTSVTESFRYTSYPWLKAGNMAVIVGAEQVIELGGTATIG